jgi:NTE family protein
MRGLVLSGGGANGAFEVGALQHILGEKRIHYDVICGVSVGALNGSILAQYCQGQEQEAVDHLVNIWDRVNENSDIYKKWCGGWLWHLPVLWHKSIYNTQALHEIVKEHVSITRLRSSGKEFRVGAVSWNDGSYRVWKQTQDTIRDAILASSSFPIFFEPIQIHGEWFTDGGLRDVTPIKAAIDAGCDRIDVIQCGCPEVPETRRGLPNLLKQLQISLDVVLDEVDRNDYEKAVFVNRLVKAGASDKKLIELHRLRSLTTLGDSLNFGADKKDKIKATGRRLASAYSSW